MTCEPWARDWRITAVVAEPEEKAKAKRACSSAATAFSKLSLDRSELTRHTGKSVEVPIGIRASRVFVCTYWLPDACLCESCREGNLK